MAGQSAHALRDVECAALAHPMTEEIKTKARIAQIDQMRAGIGQRDHSGLVLDQRLHPIVNSIEKPADQPGGEVLLEPEIEQHVERIAPSLARDVSYRAIGEPGILGFDRCRDDDTLSVALKDGTRLGVAQVGAECASEARVAEHGLKLLAIIGLNRVEGGVAVERVRARQREVE